MEHIISLLLVILTTASVYAENFKVFFIIAENHPTFTQEDAVHLFDDFNHILKKETPHKATLYGVGEMDLGGYVLLNQFQFAPIYVNILVKEAFPICRLKNIQCIILMHPVFYNNNTYVGGAAYICGVRTKGLGKRLPVVMGSMQDIQGNDTYHYTLTTLVHEFGHHLGAKHRNNKINFMHPYVLDYVDTFSELKILPRSRREIQKCLYD